MMTRCQTPLLELAPRTDKLLRAQALHDRHKRIGRRGHIKQPIARRAVLLVAIFELGFQLVEARAVTISAGAEIGGRLKLLDDRFIDCRLFLLRAFLVIDSCGSACGIRRR